VRRGAVVVVLVALSVAWIVWIASGDGELSTGPGTRLRDGIRVAPGTELIGVVFPAIDQNGWSAVLDVRTDARSALNAYAAQARRLGFKQFRGNGAGCSGPRDGRVACSARYSRGAESLEIWVVVCGCENPTPISMGVVSVSSARGSTANATAPIALVPRTEPTLALSPRQRAASARAVVQANAGRGCEEFGGCQRFGPIAVPRVPGSSLIAQALYIGTCEGDWKAVMRVERDSSAVLDGYVMTMNDQFGTPTASRRVRNGNVSSVSSRWEGGVGSVSWTLVDSGGRRGFLFGDFCSD
jgi:hypothetical protein